MTEFFPFPYTLTANSTTPAPDPGPPPVVLIYGDSYTQQGTWPLIVRDRLRLSVGNDAISGSGFVTVNGHSTFFHAVAVQRARRGGHHHVRGAQRSPVAADAGGGPLAATVTLAAARAANQRAQLVLVGPQWPATNRTPLILAIRDELQAAAADAGVTYVDPSGWFVGRPDLIRADRLRPNPAGQAMIADQMTVIIGLALDRYTKQETTA